MFSFDRIKRVFKGLKQDWLWLFVSVFLFLNCFFIFRQLRDRVYFSRDTSYKSQAIRFIEDDGDKVKWCFLGSSLTYTGIDPELFQRESINLAGESFNADICHKLFNIYKNRLPNLEIVVVELSPVSLLVDTIEHRCNQDHLESFFDWKMTSRSIAPPLLYTTEVYAGELFAPTIHDPVHSYLLSSSNDNAKSKKFLRVEPGFVALQSQSEEETFPPFDETAWKTGNAYWKANEEVIQTQIASLRKIQQYCKSHQIDFAVVLPPLHSSIKKTEVFASYTKVVSELLRTEFINKSHVCNCSQLVPDKHFRDPAHMDYKGSRIYSKYVYQYFKKIVVR